MRSIAPSLPAPVWSVKESRLAWYPYVVGQDGALPIFPLASVVLFPLIRTPLHIFEPRYRQMTQDALAGDRRIGMIAVLPDHLASMSGEPPIYSIGCAGVIEAAQQLPDGRYNMVLSGTQRFRVLGERSPTGERLYRAAEVELLEDPHSPSEQPATAALRVEVLDQVGELLRRQHPKRETQLGSLLELDDARLVNTLSSSFNFAPREKQALLEANGVHARFEQLSELLGFALAELEAGRTSNSGPLH